MHHVKKRQNIHENLKIRILVERRQAEKAANQQKRHFRYVETRFLTKNFVREKTAKKFYTLLESLILQQKKGCLTGFTLSNALLCINKRRILQISATFC